MGNSCNYCPGGGATLVLTNFNNGFTEEVRTLIDSIREKNKHSLPSMKEVNLPDGKIFRGTLVKGQKQGYGEYFQNNNSYFGIF
jgi:hypothetical protein